uniref:Uncharacterized protein LOC114348379 n=1 Tax=Diabrotica virgifera virgifera TaxID=50390 RepID=A0A6P7HGG5_DIAVI
TYANATTSENKTLNPQFPIQLASQKAFPLIPSQALPYSSRFSQSSPIDSHKYTIYRNPTKRARPQTPDPCINEAIKITKPTEIARLQGGILSQESYRENIIKTNEMSETETITLVFELVMDILKSLNRDNILNVQQFEVVNIIKDRLNKQGLATL